MNGAVRIMRDHATAAEISAHLRECADRFVPPLIGRVDIDAYADKIWRRALRFEAWDGNGLVGLIAAYGNDTTQPAAFITSVSVTGAHAGRGLGSQLLRACLDNLREIGWRSARLEVDMRNTAALHLYRGHGFEVCGTAGDMMTMALQLTGRNQ